MSRWQSLGEWGKSGVTGSFPGPVVPPSGKFFQAFIRGIVPPFEERACG